ncbi:toxin VasX [Modicisalibacter ilicicola]|uniref:toxin VasX n=1 Tax=Modicisalibacter ilicicola TaxID=480814 RepID=UPI0030F45DC7
MRYALGYEELSSDFLSVLDVPDLGGSLLAESDAQESVPLSYVARPLRDGWCYVWLETQRRLVEYRVTQGMLDETSRGGPIVMPGGGAYLFLPADAPARLAWSPVRWSERHYAKLQGNSEHRQALMRAIVPGQGPASGPLAWATQVPELNGAPPSVFAWSSEPGAELPRWETMMPTLTQAEIQAVAVIDDPWGLLLDLAHLVRAVLNRREAWFAEEGEERSLAQQILALAKQNREFWAELPTLADQPRIEEAATRYDAEIAERDAQLAALLADWQCWMETTQAQGASLQAAQRHFDPAEAEHHDAMETLWSAVLLGPTQSRAGAASVERLMDPARSFWAPDTEHSLWAALLGHREPLTLADVTRLLAVGDLGADNDWQGWANGLNQLSATLGQTSAALREGLFVALGPLIGPLLKQHGAASAHHTLVAGYFAAALARSGQRLSATPVPAQVMVDWLNAPGARAANAPASLGRLRPDLLPELQGKTLTTLRLAAPASAPTGNPFVEALGDARLKSLLLILNGVMLVEAGEALVEEGRSFDTTTGFLSSLFGTAAVAGAIGQQVLELKADRVLATEGMSAVWKARYEFFLIAGQGTSFTLGLATAFDSVYFGRQALDSLGRGDRDSAAVQAGMSAASAGQAALAARAFWLYRRARAALLMGRTLEASALASRAGAPGAMLGLVLLIVGGAISLRFTREKPLQQWLRNTRFGTHPAAWAGDLAQELDRLFRLLYAPRARLERRDEWNHALNTRHVAVWLTIEFPGATPPFPGMFTWQAKERWKAGWFGSETRDVVLTEKDLALDIGERHRGGPAYRRIYHATPEDETLLAIGGTLHYRPHPGLILQPFTLSID